MPDHKAKPSGTFAPFSYISFKRIDKPKLCKHHIEEEEPVLCACSKLMGKTVKWNGVDTLVTFLPEHLPRANVKPELVHFVQTNIFRSTRDEPYLADELKKRRIHDTSNVDGGLASVRHVLRILAAEVSKCQKINYQDFKPPNDINSSPIYLQTEPIPSANTSLTTLPHQIAIYPTLTACQYLENAAESIIFAVPADAFRALCPSIPVLLAPPQPNRIPVVSLNLPSPAAAIVTFLFVFGGVRGCDIIKTVMGEDYSWSPEPPSPFVLGQHLVYGASNERKLNADEQSERVVAIITLIEGLIRLSFNFCKLGFYDEVVLDYLDVVYNGCMDALLQIGFPISVLKVCGHDELLRLMRSNRTLPELYMEMIGYRA